LETFESGGPALFLNPALDCEGSQWTPEGVNTLQPSHGGAACLAGPLEPHRWPRPSRQTGHSPWPHTRRLRPAEWEVGGPPLCASVQLGPARAAAAQAVSAEASERVEVGPCVNTRYFSLRLISAYPCHKLSPTYTEG
jgi:hypothetical protein